MRMNADGRVDELISVGQLNPTVERSWTGTASDRDNGLNASLPRPRDYLFAVGIKLFHLEMCVGIYKHGVGRLSEVFRATINRRGQPGRVFYFSLVPTGTSSRKLARIAFPPSGEAATIIPFDSRPRNLRGARLATITTLRPIKLSGVYDSAIPATTCRTSVPRSTSRRNSLSALGTFSATFTWPTRSSIFAKSSMEILPSAATDPAGIANADC